ncbi:MAG: response regulator [Lachnospiraceae bacterium]|nr:response regulator [Lachnospiraceae bacterium]
MKVLIVDDEPFITQGLSVLIDWEKEGYEIAACLENGKQAYNYLKENDIDLVLTDIRMPEMSGLDLMERVKDEGLSDASFVIMSGYDDFGYAQKALRIGCVDYLLKPVDAGELLEIVRNLSLNEKNRQQEEERQKEIENAYRDRNVISRLIGTYDSDNPQKIICNEVLDNLVRAIEINDPEKIGSLVHAFYREAKEKGLSEESVNFNISYLLFQLIRIASEQDEEVNHEEIMNFISESSFEESVLRGKSDIMIRFCLEYAEYISQLRKSSVRSVLSDVEKEIREHYAENLSLREMSRKFFINNAYLGQMFKKKYGVSFKDYLTDYRIREAAKLLAGTDRKIINIAEDVGYKDSDYFVQKFIERMGCTPSNYRKEKQSG